MISLALQSKISHIKYHTTHRICCIVLYKMLYILRHRSAQSFRWAGLLSLAILSQHSLAGRAVLRPHPGQPCESSSGCSLLCPVRRYALLLYTETVWLPGSLQPRPVNSAITINFTANPDKVRILLAGYCALVECTVITPNFALSYIHFSSPPLQYKLQLVFVNSANF